jgi:hypothetical protein
LLVGMVFNSWSNLRLTAESCYAGKKRGSRNLLLLEFRF